jgi:tetratricopeptide (TPR) repeat protein
MTDFPEGEFMKRVLTPLLIAVAGLNAAVASAVNAPPHDHDHGPATKRPISKATKSSRRTLEARVEKTLNALVRKSDDLWHKGEFEDMAFCQRMIVELDPEDVQTWSSLGWVHWACLNDEAAAEKTLREGLALNPDRYELYDELGGYLYRRKRYGEAAALFHRAVKFKDAHHTTWNVYGHSLERMGKPERAAEVWREMKRRFPANPSPQVNLDRMKRKGLIP